MTKKNPQYLILIFLLLIANQSFAQQRKDKNKTRMSQEERTSTEQMAYQFYNNKEFEQAKPLFLKLHEGTNSQYYLLQYIECLLFLNEFDEAEKLLNKQIKDNPKNWRAQIDIGYVYQLKNQQSKAERTFEKIIQNLPTDKNNIYTIANIFRSRGLFDYAIMTYEKGAKNNTDNYPFYIEKATTYQSNGNLEKSFENYISHLEYQPNQLDLIKSRFQVFLMRDIDHSISDVLREKLLEVAQKNPENETFGQLLIWFAIQQKDYEIAVIQAEALDRRFGDREGIILNLAQIAVDNEQLESAKDAYQYIVDKGQKSAYYLTGFIGLMQTEYLIAKEDPATKTAVYQNLAHKIEKGFDDFGFNKETYPLVLTLVNIQAFRLHDFEKANQKMEEAMNLMLSDFQKAEVKLLLADIYLLQDEVWEATLLYSQVDKTMKEEPLGHEARFRNAKLRYYIGEFAWAQMQLKVLKSATSKLIANDALTLSLVISDNLEEDTTGVALKKIAKADLLLYQQKPDEADKELDSLWEMQPYGEIVPHLLIRKAEIAVQKENNQLADSLYKRLYIDFPDSYMADDALMRSAVLNEKSLNNKTLALERYELLIDQYPASIYAATARRKYRMLRGN